MGQRQTRLVSDLVAVEEQVEIDRPRAVAHVADTPEALLDVEQPLEKLPRRQVGRDLDSAVQERPLLDRPDRLGLAQPRDGDDLDPRPRRRAGRAPVRR